MFEVKLSKVNSLFMHYQISEQLHVYILLAKYVKNLFLERKQKMKKKLTILSAHIPQMVAGYSCCVVYPIWQMTIVQCKMLCFVEGMHARNYIPFL